MNIYVASSWRNPWQPGVIKLLRGLGHEVYDFREPTEGNRGFSWKSIDPKWREWSPERYREALTHPLARAGFASDANALSWCDACIAVQPYGISTAMELAWAAGTHKRTCVFFPRGIELTAIDGHQVHAPDALCEPCTQKARKPTACLLPEKIDHVEPELMVFLAGEIIIGPGELIDWVTDTWPRAAGAR